MIKKAAFYVLLAVLGYVLYRNPNFETVAAGIAILLFGMIMLEEGFKVFAKGPLQTILKKTTDKVYKSLAAGALVTAFIQSSSLVSIVAISFVSAGLIGLVGGMGLIFGANMGTTATAWLVAAFGLKIKISALAMPMLVFGIVFSLQKRPSLKGLGSILAGLGFFFLGIFYMKEGFDTFKEFIDLTEYAIPGFMGILVYIGVGIVITAMLQSSSATLALILTALAAGQIEYDNALGLTIGANIGTTITAILGSISSNVAGKRLAGAHLIFKLVTGIVALAILYPLMDLVDFLIREMGIAEDDFTLKLAMFHTVFNIMGVIIVLPFMQQIERFLLWLLKEKKEKGIEEPKFLNETIMELPGTAVNALMKETRYLYENAIFEIVTHAMNIHREDVRSDLETKEVVKNSKDDFGVDVRELYYSKVKTIYGEIIRYATTLQSTQKMAKEQNDTLSEIIVANRKMVEIIKATIEMRINISQYLGAGNKDMEGEYDAFRKKLVKVLRVIYQFKTEADKQRYHDELLALRREAKKGKHLANASINTLIAENRINADMASSLLNDKDNLNEIIKNLISVAELLYLNEDSLFQNDTDPH
ncbi:Na/Pi cotransporter family protein [Maribacter sp. 2307ULW6-5]|uniref:Na/Pi cotransporter family protein n=1 Tax=Maribacter sp. 2307ULW6-5 TaxID=3386275 RepID=UPI0039BD9216